MIGIIFQFVNEIIEVRIVGKNCFFRTSQFGAGFVPIDSIRLEKKGVIKEYPDLKDNENWREEAVKRFKEHIKNMETEDKIKDYVISELKKCGYIPMYLQREGHRPIKL